MREFFSEMFLFIYSTLSHWQALVSGGIVTALIAIFERLSGYHLNKKTYVGLFVGVFLLVAFFLGWREEYRGRMQQLAEVNKMLLAKPRFSGQIIYLGLADAPESPSKLALTTIVTISNTGSTPSIADDWDCYLTMEGRDGIEIVHGEGRAIPNTITLSRGANTPMVFGRDDALYVKTMRNPIAAGAKVVGVMYYHFPRKTLDNFRSSDRNTLTMEFRDVLREKHTIVRRYLIGGYDTPKGTEWVDIPGMDRPTNVPPPTAQTPITKPE